MIKHRHLRVRRTLAVALIALGGSLLVATGGPSTAQTAGVTGSAYGYSLNVSLFTAPQPPVGPTPTVALPPEGSATPVTASAATGSARAGPAIFFSSGPINLSTEGTSGGTVATSAEIETLNTSQQESLSAERIASTCEATGADPTGSTTITNGTLLTDSGWTNEPPPAPQPNPPIPDHPPVSVVLPADPAPNTEITGHIHVNGTTDEFRFVFNEQVVDDANGLITVNAAHQYLLGPSAVGDLIIGQAVCSATAAVTTTTTTAPPAPTTTVAPGGGTTTGGTGQPLARTGGGDLKLAISAASLLVLGAMLFFGFGDRPAWAGVTAARRTHRRRAPWDRRRRW